MVRYIMHVTINVVFEYLEMRITMTVLFIINC